MALFDKLKGVLDKAEDAAKEISSSIAKDLNMKESPLMAGTKNFLQSAKNPLSDPEINQYFQIACGMNGFYKWAGHKLFSDAQRDSLYPKFKIYAEHILSKACDDAKLKKAWELFFSAGHIASYGQAAKNYEFREKTEDSNVYQLHPYDACRLCHPEKIAEFAAKYERILIVIEDDVSYANFDEGVQRLISKNILREKDKLEECIVQIVVANSFCAGNSITQDIVLELVKDNIRKSNADNFVDKISLLALKALHFENYSGNKENYTTVTKEEVCDLLQSEPYYKEQIDKQLFDKDEYFDMLADRVVNANIFKRPTSAWGYFRPEYVDHYYCDMICNLLWKESANSQDWTINGEKISQSTDPAIVLKIVANYFGNKG